MTMVRRFDGDAGPSAESICVGIWITWCTVLAGDLDLGEADGGGRRAGARVVRGAVEGDAQSVERARRERERLPRRERATRAVRSKRIGCLPSKVSVTGETQRDRSPRWGWTSVMWSVVTGVAELRLPPLARTGWARRCP